MNILKRTSELQPNEGILRFLIQALAYKNTHP